MIDLPLIVLEDGTVRRLRPLGYGDVLFLRRLLGRALEAIGQQWDLFAFITVGLPAIRTEAQAWLATVVRQPRTLTELARVLQALAEHPDVATFFKKLFPEPEPEAPEPSGPGKPIDLHHLLHMVQKEYGWADSYVMNDPWSERDCLSYTRWFEVLEAVCQDATDRKRDAWMRAAFVGWHQYFFQPHAEHHTPLTPAQWFEAFGLAEAPEVPSSQEVLEAARELMAKFGVEL